MTELYHEILDQLKGMDSLKVKKSKNFASNIKKIKNIGEIVIEFHTERKEFSLLGLINLPRNVPLATLDEVHTVLSEVPDAYLKLKGRNYLIYGKTVGEEVVENSGYLEKITVHDQVSVRLKPLHLKPY